MNNVIRKMADEVRFVREFPYPHQDAIFDKFAMKIINICIEQVNNSGIEKQAIEDVKRNILTKFDLIPSK